MKIAVFSTQPYDKQFLQKHNSNFGYSITFFEETLHTATSRLAAGFDVVCVFVHDRLDAACLQQLSKCGVRLVALRCAGFNHVDLATAAQLGMHVVRVPAYSPHAVAEHALALILTLNRKTHKAYNRVREGNFSINRLMGFDLYAKTVGVVGTGQIGSVFCRIMLGLGCHILAYDKQPSPALQALGVVYTSLEALFRAAHIISLHCPLTPETHHLINRHSFDQMQDGVMLINTSRGGLVNTSDAIRALKSGKLGALGIDVYEQEENLFFRDLSELLIDDEQLMRLMTFPNVLITAHQGFFTQEAMNQIAHITLSNIRQFALGQVLDNEVKPDRVCQSS